MASDWETHQRIRDAILGSLTDAGEDEAMAITDAPGASEEELRAALDTLVDWERASVPARVQLRKGLDAAITELVALRAEVAAQRPVVAAAARYGAALAALRAEQDRLHSIGYTGLRADSPDFDRLSGEQYVALDVLDCIAVVLARATPDAEEKGDGR